MPRAHTPIIPTGLSLVLLLKLLDVLSLVSSNGAAGLFATVSTRPKEEIMKFSSTQPMEEFLANIPRILRPPQDAHQILLRTAQL